MFFGPWTHQNAFDSVVNPVSAARAVPPALVKAIIAQESAFKPNATGAAGERGLMQIMERTARALGHSGHLDLLYDVRVNIPLGTRLLGENYRQANGRWDVAIAAYNAGWDRNNIRDARRNADGTFTNQSYVDNVMDNWRYFDPGAPIAAAAPRSTSKAGNSVGIGLLGLLLAWLFGKGR